MMLMDRYIRQALGVLAVLWVVPAAAQENLYANKTAAQIFASDCAMCHKQPQSLAKAGGPLGFGIESFLRSHYTASRESAALMAKYIQSMDVPAASERKRGSTAAKPRARKQSDAKPEDKKSEPVSDTKTETKPAETKPVEAKPAEKPPEAKPVEAPKPEKTE